MPDKVQFDKRVTSKTDPWDEPYWDSKCCRYRIIRRNGAGYPKFYLYRILGNELAGYVDEDVNKLPLIEAANQDVNEI